MLLWEHLGLIPLDQGKSGQTQPPRLISRRLPYDTRCSVIIKSGRRCKGRIRKGSDFCMLHDPVIAEKRRRAGAKPKNQHPLAKLPDGYLRRLSTRASVGVAMDRLYREIRLGIVTPEMGRVLFEILTRLMDSGLLDQGRPPKSNRDRASRLRPKVSELLTRSEKSAWKRAVANAPVALIHADAQPQPAATLSDSAVARALNRPAALEQSPPLKLHAAS